MSNRIFLWTLAALAVALFLVPIVGMLGMINAGWMMGGGMMGDGTMGGGTIGMGVFGALWLLLAHHLACCARGVAGTATEQGLSNRRTSADSDDSHQADTLPG